MWYFYLETWGPLQVLFLFKIEADSEEALIDRRSGMWYIILPWGLGAPCIRVPKISQVVLV